MSQEAHTAAYPRRTRRDSLDPELRSSRWWRLWLLTSDNPWYYETWWAPLAFIGLLLLVGAILVLVALTIAWPFTGVWGGR